jgi:aminoglycoside phosphotransferase (APT) family kinase protein
VTHAEIELTAELIRELLREQHPDLAERPLALGARGWDNQLWRLGDDLAVRLPWQTDAADALLLKEHTWLPALAPLLPLPVPIPQRLGHRSERYPHPWIVTTWVPGTPADRAPARNGGPTADALVAFLTALHQPAPTEAPEGGGGRGGPLARVAEGVASGLDAMTDLCAALEGTELGVIPDPDAVRAIFDDAVAAPGWAGPPLWLHGDLHPANVLTADGILCGVVDFGDLCAGDPALDIAAGWILLPDHESIERFQGAYGRAGDDATWRRARGWAVWRALGGLLVATADHAGAKPSWGPPALASLQRLAASVA